MEEDCQHVMLDLETMSVEPDAAIVQIGAVQFDLYTGRIESRFDQKVTLESNSVHGRIIDASTVQWWIEQSAKNPKLRSVFEGGIPLSKALLEFSQWVGGMDDKGAIKVWGNGVDFDNVVLGRAYKAAGVIHPWHFRFNRCYRTMKNLFPEVTQEAIGEHHNALDDAVYQAKHLAKIFQKIRGVHV